MLTTQNLDVLTLPLQGRHLIEASAGTGKTFNITRLYLRLLLEKSLTVEQILVMTFTKAATEEIRGRLSGALREALAIWQSKLAGETGDWDDFYDALYQACPGETGIATLQASLLEMDDASIFTIHGFCNYVLDKIAFASQEALTSVLETDTSAMYELAIADWIRQTSRDADAFYLLAEQGWHTPDAFKQQFLNVIRFAGEPLVLSAEDYQEEQQRSVTQSNEALRDEFDQVLSHLRAHQVELHGRLIQGHKQEVQRLDEWELMLDWIADGDIADIPKAVGDFINGNRMRGDKNADLKAILLPVKTLRDTAKKAYEKIVKDSQQRVSRVDVFTLVKQGIDYVRAHVAKQKTGLNVLDFDDLILRLARSVEQHPEAVAKLQEMFPVALVDEFQDTDAKQYHILSTTYPSNDSSLALFMIGDPKQAIYGFRGGDIFTYLKAGQDADYRWVMDTNWRSTPQMVNGYNRLFHGTGLSQTPRDVFGYGIRYEQVKASPFAKANKTPFADDQPQRDAMTFFALAPDEEAPNADATSHQLSEWMTAELLRLLNHARLGERNVRPADIAILVRSGREAQRVKYALNKVGLKSVYLSNKTSLFDSAEAKDILRLLRTIWFEMSGEAKASGLSSPLLGLSTDSLIQLLHQDNDAVWEQIHQQMISLRKRWQSQGVMALILHLMQVHYQPRQQDIERQLTNYLHLAEVLEDAEQRQTSPESLILWLERELANSSQAETWVQRLESDAQLVKIVTQHGSKGLEYPVVFVPFTNSYRDPAKFGNQLSLVNQYHDESTQQMVVQLGHSAHSIEQVRAQGQAEDMRLLYVAITRAVYRCYLGMGHYQDSHNSAIGKALGDDSDWHAQLLQIVSEGENIACVSVEPVDIQSYSLPQEQKPVLELARFTGDYHDNWRLHSFSGLTRQSHSMRQTQRAVEPSTILEPVKELPGAQFRFEFEKGAHAGNLLHDILEHCDFQQPSFELVEELASKAFKLEQDELDQLFQWIVDVLSAPLGIPHCPELCLADLTSQQTLKEAEFYYPIDQLNWDELVAILNHHRRAFGTGDDYVRVNELSQEMCEGMMHGFIDLTFEHDGRFYVADYKSTHLGNDFANYQTPAIWLNNQHHLYDLQYLIYSLALHRYLQQKLPDYSPDVHFGGVAYLYLRGMSGDAELGNGVYFAEIDSDTLTRLDALFGTDLSYV